jgi:DNA repair protein RecO (recombination protein O)
VASEKAQALVLRLVEFSESSCVVTLFTREFGKVRGLAKGARRPKGPFESALDLLARCGVVFLRKSTESLDLLTEAKLERRFRPRAGDLAGLYSAYYVAELLGELTDDYDPHPELYDAAVLVLARLSDRGASADLVTWFELTALRRLGHLPMLDACAECGGGLQPSERVPFGQLAGGVLCPKCRSGKRQVASISGGAWRAMRELAATATPAEEPRMDRRTAGEVRGILNHYLAGLAGHTFQMHRYLGTLAAGSTS